MLECCFEYGFCCLKVVLRMFEFRGCLRIVFERLFWVVLSVVLRVVLRLF